MSQRIREHLRSNVVGYVAIFLFAIAGTAYAANTIGSADIINGQVKSADIGNNQVYPADVRDDTLPNGGLDSADVRENTLSVPTAGIANHAVTAGKLATAPAASVLKLNPETTHSAAGTILHADYELYDTANLHDNSTDTENLVAPVDGTYFVSATVEWDPSGAGYRRTSLLGAGGGTFASVAGPPLPSPAYTSQNVAGVERLAAGQAVQVQALQGSDADLSARIVRFEMALMGGF
jgi:hypothetical protein